MSPGSSITVEAAGRSRRIEVVLLFFLSPIVSLWVAMRNPRASSSRNVLWAFTAFFGFTFIIAPDMDSSRYSAELARLSLQSTTTLEDFVGLIYQKESGYVDLVAPLITFIVSRFTNNDRVLFAVFGFIFGYFYSRNIWMLFSLFEGRLQKRALVFFLMSAFTIAIWQVNGFRFWTAAHIFIYGIFTWSKVSKVRGFLICSSSLLMHFSFVLPLLVLFAYWVLGNRIVVFSILYFASFSLAQISPKTLESYFKDVPEIFRERASKYTSELYIKTRQSMDVKTNWYVNGRSLAIHYALNILLIYFLLRLRSLLDVNYVAKSLLGYGLLLATVLNLFSQVPSMPRFQLVADVLLFAFFMLVVQSSRTRLLPRPLYLVFLLAAMLYLVVEFRIGFETTSLLTVLGNPIVAPFLPNGVPLISFFK